MDTAPSAFLIDSYLIFEEKKFPLFISIEWAASWENPPPPPPPPLLELC